VPPHGLSAEFFFHFGTALFWNTVRRKRASSIVQLSRSNAYMFGSVILKGVFKITIADTKILGLHVGLCLLCAY
jgi:hypothetical protein